MFSAFLIQRIEPTSQGETQIIEDLNPDWFRHICTIHFSNNVAGHWLRFFVGYQTIFGAKV